MLVPLLGNVLCIFLQPEREAIPCTGTQIVDLSCWLDANSVLPPNVRCLLAVCLLWQVCGLLPRKLRRAFNS
uniref:Putative secreted protein n=1 Tax=Anopheles darlingi TaxID=43151 RepID=A0A2M4DCB5_ANODA